jgi:hypothetical protein
MWHAPHEVDEGGDRTSRQPPQQRRISPPAGLTVRGECVARPIKTRDSVFLLIEKKNSDSAVACCELKVQVGECY